VNTATKPLQYAAGAHVDDNFALVVDKPEHRKFEAFWYVHFKKPAKKTPPTSAQNPPIELQPFSDQSFTGLQIQKLGGRMHRDSPLLMGSL